MGTRMHVHMLDAPLSLVPHHGGATPRMEVAEALIAAVMDSCETCTDQLTVLVMKGDPQVVAHLVGAGWHTGADLVRLVNPLPRWILWT